MIPHERQGDLPAPDRQTLEVTIECTGTPGDRYGIQHRIAIDPDWSVQSREHDLDAERIARSLGGWCSCLHFAEHVVPAFRDTIQRMRSTSGPDARGLHPGRFPGAPDRPRRDPAASLVAQEEQRMYEQLFLDAGRVWAAWGDSRYVQRGFHDYLLLWREGVLPTTVAEIARSLPREAWPLPHEFYLDAHCSELDRDWLTNVISCYPTRDFAMWAVQQSDGRRQRASAQTVWRMYELGIQDRDAIGALDAQVPLETLLELAERPGVGGITAARWLTVWARLGVMPSGIHYRLLEARRALLDRPAPWLLDWLAAALRRFGPEGPTRTELAVMLALTSDVGLIERAVAGGIRTATDVRFLRLIDQHRSITRRN